MVVTICVTVQVFADGLVEANETLQLQLATDDTAILLVDPITTEITIINSDGEHETQRIHQTLYSRLQRTLCEIVFS